MYHLKKWCVQEKTGENYELLIHLYWVGTEQRYTHTHTHRPVQSATHTQINLSLSTHTHTHTLHLPLSLSLESCVCVPGWWYIVCPVLYTTQLVLSDDDGLACTCRRRRGESTELCERKRGYHETVLFEWVLWFTKRRGPLPASLPSPYTLKFPSTPLRKFPLPFPFFAPTTMLAPPVSHLPSPHSLFTPGILNHARLFH